QRVLDVGCGPGRHAHALAAKGIAVVGLDIRWRFVELASTGGGGQFVRGAARHLPFVSGSFDAAITLCQGGFGLVPGEDGHVLAEMARCVRPGGLLAATAFSSYFVVRHLEDSDDFDPAAGVNHELATVRSESGEEAVFD